MKKEKQKDIPERKRAAPKTQLEKTNGKRRIIAIVIWCFMLVCIGATVFLILTYGSTKTLLSDATSIKDSIFSESRIEKEASSFAEAYVKEYYTYDANSGSDEYTKRLTPYMAKGMDVSEPMCSGKMSVITLNTRSVDVVDENSADVTVYAKVTFSGDMDVTVTGKKGKKSTTQRYATKTSNILITVPVDYADGNYAVVDEPMLSADSNVGSSVKVSNRISGDSLSDGENKKIKEVVTNFLNAYYGTSASELAYFVTKDYGTATPLGGGQKVESIDDIQAKATTKGYDVQVEFTATNDISSLKQRVYLKVVKGAEDRLYISQLSTRYN